MKQKGETWRLGWIEREYEGSVAYRICMAWDGLTWRQRFEWKLVDGSIKVDHWQWSPLKRPGKGYVKADDLTTWPPNYKPLAPLSPSKKNWIVHDFDLGDYAVDGIIVEFSSREAAQEQADKLNKKPKKM